MKYFKREEFACHCGCGTNGIQDSFIEKLDLLRETYGKPIIVSSGYRCPKHNSAVSSTGATGPHTTGRAADILIRGAEAIKLLTRIILMNDFTGIGLNQKGSARFIHVDDLPNTAGQPRPTIWTY